MSLTVQICRQAGQVRGYAAAAASPVLQSSYCCAVAELPDSAEVLGLSHVSLSVADLDRSRAFYRNVLRLPVFVDTFDGSVFDGREVMFRVRNLVFNLQEHTTRATDDEFDPVRVGLDHLAFAVASVEALESWAGWLDENGVDHSEIKDIGFGHMIEVRDPDGIQLELFARREQT